MLPADSPNACSLPTLPPPFLSIGGCRNGHSGPCRGDSGPCCGDSGPCCRDSGPCCEHHRTCRWDTFPVGRHEHDRPGCRDRVSGCRHDRTGGRDGLSGCHHHRTGGRDRLSGCRHHRTGGRDHLSGRRNDRTGGRDHLSGCRDPRSWCDPRSCGGHPRTRCYVRSRGGDPRSWCYPRPCGGHPRARCYRGTGGGDACPRRRRRRRARGPGPLPFRLLGGACGRSRLLSFLVCLQSTRPRWSSPSLPPPLTLTATHHHYHPRFLNFSQIGEESSGMYVMSTFFKGYWTSKTVG